jgi:hypothetical protein
MRAALLMLILCASTTPALYAQSSNAPGGVTGSSGGGLGEVRDWINGKPPVPPEEPFTMPSVVSLREWAVLEFPQQNRSNRYTIALDSIAVGKDSIVRYAVAVKPLSGNVTTLVYEGLDCETNQYRRYASATSGSEWRNLKSVEWKPSLKNGHNAWQGYLADDFCSLNTPYKVEVIKKNFGKPLQQSECHDCLPKQ